MFDKILGLLVLVVPVALGLVVILVPAKHENQQSHMRWRIALGICLIAYGGLAWWQQTRFTDASTKDREEAIAKTSEKVSESVSKSVAKSVGEQYTQTINTLQSEIGELRGQLRVQDRNLETIKGSKIVSGREPLKVQVMNQAGAVNPNPSIQVARLQVSPNPEYGTRYAIHSYYRPCDEWRKSANTLWE